MSNAIKVYDYKVVRSQNAAFVNLEDELNRLGAEGYTIVGISTDVRDGSIGAVIMQRETVVQMVNEGAQEEGETEAATSYRRRGR